MKIRHNPDDRISCENTPPWYNQLLKMSAEKRKVAYKVAMDRIQEAKPEAFEFIKNTKAELVGFMPNVSYTLPDDKEDSLDVTFIHDFSQYTMLFWCPLGEFAFFINASLKYNDGVQGFTY